MLFRSMRERRKNNTMDIGKLTLDVARYVEGIIISIPYSVTVEIEQFKVNERGTYEINGLILVEREGQKKMVIGAQGQKIKTIGMEARADMERLFDNKVHLELWVKVKSGWADDERALRSLGYMDE